MFRPFSIAGRRARNLRLAGAVIFFGLLSATLPAGAAAPGTTTASTAAQWVPGRLLVQPRPGLSAQELDRILGMHGAKSIGRIAQINVHIVQLPTDVSEKAVAAALARNPHIKFAELDMRLKPAATVDDPYFSSAWHLPKIAAPTAWDTSTGGGVVIAILDSGADATHPDLVGKLVPGWNFYDNNSDTSDVEGHGTEVAGTAAAASNNATGVASVAGGAKIMPIRVTDTSGYGYFSMMASGITWAADHGARLANMSFVASGSASVQSAAQYMKNKGGLVTTSAGNYGTESTIAASDTMITVSATDGNDALASWSSYGNFVDVAAPGVGIWTTTRGGGYGAMSGTSYSAPVTAGVLALMMATNPSLGAADIQSRLFSTAKDFGGAGWDKYYGYGRVDAAAAVQASKSPAPTDTGAPTVSLGAPASGATVSGLVAVNVNASDNVGVSRVDLLVNGTKLASDTTAPYGFSWDSTTVPNGTVTLAAYAYDAAGNYSSSSVGVTVANSAAPPPTTDTVPPVATISAPSNGAKVNGNVTVQASATDNVGVVSMNLYIDGQLASSINGASLAYGWKVQRIAAGTHTLKVEAKDAAGNVGSQSIQVVR